MSNLDSSPSVSQEIIPKSQSIDILSVTNQPLQDEIREDYGDDINKLTPELKKKLLEQWKNEDQKNIGTFINILNNIQKEAVAGEKEAVAGEKEAVAGEKEAVAGEKILVEGKEKSVTREKITNKLAFSIKEDEAGKNFIETNKAVKSALNNSKKLTELTGGKYNKEIQETVLEQLNNDDSKKFLLTLGIDISKPEELARTDVQGILLARASTIVYLNHKEDITKNFPATQSYLDQLESTKNALGINESSSAKTVGNLLRNTPKEPREAIIATVTTINKDSPNNTITRNGDKLTFADPKNEKYSYEIDVGKYPPVLTKKLGNLSIDIQKVQDNPERKKKEQEYTNIHTEKEKTAGDINADLQRATIGHINLDNLTKEDYEALANSSRIEKVLEDIKKPYAKEQLSEKIAKLRSERAIMEGGGKILDKVALQYAEYIYQSRLDIENTGVSESSKTPSIEEDDFLTKINQIVSIKKSGKIEKFAKQKEEEEKVKQELGNIKSPSIEKESRIAEGNLSFLADLGYDKLGQNTINKVIQSLNREHPKTASGEYINLSQGELEKTQKQEILLAITRLMGSIGKGLMPEWDGIDKNDYMIAYRQTRSSLWNTGLQSLEKKPEFKSLIQNVDITKFQNIITGRQTLPEKAAEKPEANSAVNIITPPENKLA